MNNAMYEHAATRANLEALRKRGVAIVEPGTGELASKGEWGVGRLAEPAEILAAIEATLEPRDDYAPRSLDGLRVLVTAGGTREPIDSVRYVGNRSSGRMGFAVAQEAAARGADVTVIAANVSLPRADGVRYEDVETAADLERAARRLFPEADVLVMAAAVADFRPPQAEEQKLTKSGRDSLELRLEPTTDVIAALSAERRPEQLLVGFAAEHGEGGVERARAKLERKGLHAVVVNDISRDDIGFDAGDNEVTIVTASGQHELAKAPKSDIARAIVDLVEEMRHERRPA
jgi:phosphopantothenoylcysteine decarboxylase/phosphopantothenate--cysteine ligase